ncbi:homoserine dehydrogenase [Kitasatospora sp. MAP12-15]|uniref:homoserine dehydrogenase n=1 Tax=unclassified Kitasatospora TaxID=2633591 RepID=UPI00247356C6|nr:homoserine dehydrogenase [Kitasatospora sp. MAP12-44]MDH6113882.1 homoserine dehydrogenase [Kitasatospora sp. MAP12-44]
MNSRPLKVAVLGCGVVGTEVVRRLHGAASELGRRIGAPIELAGVAVRDLDRARGTGIDPALFTDDPFELVKRADVDIVVELVGGLEPARSLAMEAMAHGASVVSANKALIAAHGPELHAAAADRGVDLHYEAAVAGAVPLLRTLRESLAGDDIERVVGIVNGTTNFILDRMSSTGAEFAEALREATALGYAEAEPSADVEGHDAVAKAVIMTALAFHTRISPAEVHREGITAVTAADISQAQSLGHEVKLLAICERDRRDGAVAVRVHPTWVPRGHPLASVHGADNAVLVESTGAGRLLLQGAGAGGTPTASAVLGDLVATGRRRALGSTAAPAPLQLPGQLRQIGEIPTRCQLSLGTLAVADVVAALDRHEIPIETVLHAGEDLCVLTGPAPHARLTAALDTLQTLNPTHRAPRFTRLLD